MENKEPSQIINTESVAYFNVATLAKILAKQDACFDMLIQLSAKSEGKHPAEIASQYLVSIKKREVELLDQFNKIEGLK